MIIGLIGCVFWAICYIYAIRINRAKKTYTLPAVAICMNIGWEFITVVLLENPVPAWKILEAAWLGLDLVIVYQLFHYGGRHQTYPFVRTFWKPLLIAGILIFGLGQYGFVLQYHDTLAYVCGFSINVMMSFSFLGFFFERRKTGEGLSKGIAWTKMLGTICTGYEAWKLFWYVDPKLDNLSYFYFLWATIFLFDAAYLMLLYFPEIAEIGGDGSDHAAVHSSGRI
jgi:hypothetical protein